MLIMDISQLFFYIYEYKFIWCDEADSAKTKAANNRMTYLGKTLVVLKKPWFIVKKVNFLPFYPDSRNSLITGTQLIPEFNSPAKIQILFMVQSL